MVALYGHKDPRAGLAACQRTAEVADGASSVIGGLAVLHVAEAHAMLGDRRSCEQALAAADRQFGNISPDDPAIDLFSLAQPGRLAGSCYLFLGDPRRAGPGSGPRGSSRIVPRPRLSSWVTSLSPSSASPGPMKPLRPCIRRST